MPITVEVGLLSGKTASVSFDLDEKVETLKRRALTALGVARGRLLDSSGRVLDVCALIKDCMVENGDILILHLSLAQACGSNCAFAAISGDGSVVTWGDARTGGDTLRTPLMKP